ncbi:MAG: nickel-responsive transcriptional regulator NikR [Pseudomonas sp.]
MQRVTITIDDDLLAIVDSMVVDRGYTSRSEAFRDLVRDSHTREPSTEASGQCVATLTYVYDHGTRDLARKITEAHHERHDLAVASMRVHLNHDSLMECSVLKGEAQDIIAFANALTNQRGVKYSHLHAIPVTREHAEHHHGDTSVAHDHLHV